MDDDDDDDDNDNNNNNNLYSVSYGEKPLPSPSVLPACDHTARSYGVVKELRGPR